MASLKEQLSSIVEPELQAGERIETVLPRATTGLSPWLLYSFGLIGAVIASGFIKTYGLALTDHRLVFVRQTGVLRTHLALEHAYPRAAVSVTSYRSGALFAGLVLTVPNTGAGTTRTLKVDVPRTQRTDAAAIASALGWTKTT